MSDIAAFLTPETEARVNTIGKADILVGIPSYNNADTIGYVVNAVSVGLAKYFGRYGSVLVNSDGGSSDGTSAIVAQSAVDLSQMLISDHQGVLHRITTPYHGVPGKSSASRTIFEIAKRLQVKACAVVDSEVRSITPEWIELLIRPLLEQGYDYVAPYYLRHKYDGTLTTNFVYPLTRALYGQRIRQPIGGDFGFSGRLAEHCLARQRWDSDVARFGIEMWMTTEAIASGARVCQRFLGAKTQNPKDAATDLSAILRQVAGAIFGLMEEHEAVWAGREGSSPVKLFGFQYEVGIEPAHVNVERMITTFRQGLVNLGSVWAQFLSSDTMQRLRPLEACPQAAFRMADDLWARLVYDTAVAYHRRIMPREHLLQAFAPLYLGRTATFVLETRDLTSRQAEDRIETLCLSFEKQKSYLIERWKA